MIRTPAAQIANDQAIARVTKILGYYMAGGFDNGVNPFTSPLPYPAGSYTPGHRDLAFPVTEVAHPTSLKRHDF